MKKRHVRAVFVTAACAALSAVAAVPAAAAPVKERSSAGGAAVATDGRRAAVLAEVGRLRGQAEAAGGPVRAAADGDALGIPDAVDAADARGDIRSVLAGAGGGGSLLLTTQVELYANPLTDPAWINGITAPLWFLDTSGDDYPEVYAVVFNSGLGLAAEVYDYENDVFICNAVPSTNAANKSYSVTINQPGCLGDVKQPALAGAFLYQANPLAPPAVDLAPDDLSLVRFNRPPAGQPTGGYAIVSRNAGYQRFGARPAGSTPGGIFEDYIGPRPVIGAASARPFDPGLWSVTDDGEVSTQDGAEYYGDAVEFALSRPIVGMAVLPDRSGYWLVASDGGIFAFGDAGFFGSTGGIRLQQPVVGMAATPSGQGYWLVASDGGIFAYGDATFYGSTGGIPLQQPVVGMAPGYSGQGYWLVARDGGVFSYGLPFYGSTGSIRLQQPIVGMAATRSGGGYRFIARDGGLFSYGDAEFHGSGASPGRTDVVGLATA